MDWYTDEIIATLLPVTPQLFVSPPIPACYVESNAGWGSIGPGFISSCTCFNWALNPKMSYTTTMAFGPEPGCKVGGGHGCREHRIRREKRHRSLRNRGFESVQCRMPSEKGNWPAGCVFLSSDSSISPKLKHVSEKTCNNHARYFLEISSLRFLLLMVSIERFLERFFLGVVLCLVYVVDCHINHFCFQNPEKARGHRSVER